MSDRTPTSPATPLPRAVKTSIAPNGAGSKKWDTIQLGIRLGCVVLLTAAVVGFFCLSGKEITIEQIGLIIVAGAALAGISIARPGGGTGATIIGGGLIMLMLLSCQGCASSGQVNVPGCVSSAISAAVEVMQECWPRTPEAAAARAGLEQACPADPGPVITTTTEGPAPIEYSPPYLDGGDGP